MSCASTSNTTRRIGDCVVVVLAALTFGCATSGGSRGTLAPTGFCKPTQPCWPSTEEWQRLKSTLKGQLVEPRSPLAACADGTQSSGCATALESMKNPFLLEDMAGATQSMGWLHAWSTSPSAYAVAAEGASDVATAIRFARQHRMRLVVKGTGHDYLGRSSAPDSLLVWTHPMRAVSVRDAFVPQGCTTPPAPVAAVDVSPRVKRPRPVWTRPWEPFEQGPRILGPT